MVGSSVDGILREVAVDRGDRVKKGQVLARLESGIERVEVEIARSRAKAEVEILSGRARLEHLGRRADRVVELYGKKVVSTESRDEAVTEKRLAELAVAEAQMNKELRAMELERAQEILARRTIRSPATGIIHERLMSPGEFVHEQSSVVTIAAINPLHVEVFVPITLYGTVKVGMKAEVMPVEPVGGVHTATVTVVDKVFDAASGTVGVRLELPNPALRLPAGLACTVRFATQ
jgi:RND family efflux transporter MFP subunit